MRFPTWIVFVFMAFWLGPAMKWMFGSAERAAKQVRPNRHGKLDQRLDAALLERDQVIEDLQHRISELESRLDFAERLLAERREPAALP